MARSSAALYGADTPPTICTRATASTSSLTSRRRVCTCGAGHCAGGSIVDKGLDQYSDRACPHDQGQDAGEV
eukprot:11205493-Heterocapsa_arctica.AAC.1